MKYETASILIAFFGLATAAPAPRAKNLFSIPRAMLRGREVPQEHSHNRFLDGVRTSLALDNPAGILDPVFGLLGDGAAAEGAGTITNLACLHQATADQAFTNAKAAGDIVGQSDALLYAALERNTGKVGQASVLCDETALNPEIDAIQAHQDPASDNAATTNKNIVLALAQQLAAIGANPTDALLSGTFAPGQLNDNTGAGNTCDTEDDVEGCIFTQNLLVEDATADEISAAIADVSAGAGAAAGNATSAAAGAACNGSAAGSGSATGNESAATNSTVATPTSNAQSFTGTLGGAAPAVQSSAGDRPFSVNGNTFASAGAALQRSCAVQHNACANAANSGSLAGGVEQCETQEEACNSAAASAKKRAVRYVGTA